MDPFIDEVLIERYIRCPEILSARERNDLEILLERNPSARAIAAILSDFHERLATMAHEMSPEVDLFGEALFNAAPGLSQP